MKALFLALLMLAMPAATCVRTEGTAISFWTYIDGKNPCGLLTSRETVKHDVFTDKTTKSKIWVAAHLIGYDVKTHKYADRVDEEFKTQPEAEAWIESFCPTK